MFRLRKNRNAKKQPVCQWCLLLSAVAIVYLVFFTNLSIRFKVWVRNDIRCYRYKHLDALPDVLDYSPKKGRSIFFHETSCDSHEAGKLVIRARQACAIESAARMNPGYEVNVLFTSPGTVRDTGTGSDRILRVLQGYPNVRLLHVDLERYSAGTPVEELYAAGHLEASMYARSHASDVLRYLTLWRYGGIYMDLDVVVVKSLQEIAPNFAGRESDENVAAGVMGFESDGQGHAWAEQCLLDLKYNFDGYDWGNNGPGVITRLLKKLCATDDVKHMNRKVCNEFNVFAPWAFYPIPWRNWTHYFDTEHLDEVRRLTSSSFCIHVWNKHSSETPVAVGSDVPYAVFARKYCPKVYEHSAPQF